MGPSLAAAAAASSLFLPSRGLAKKSKAAAAAAPVKKVIRDDLEDIVSGLNVLKEGEDPKVKDDSEYPDWVFTLHKPLPSLEDLTKRYQADKDSLNAEEMRRMIRQWNRKRIKESNEGKKK